MISLHLEPTTRCTLACPRCERTVLIDKFGKKNFGIHDIDVASLVSFINCPVDNISLCGNKGDPIYHPNFIDLVTELKKLCKRISIITNGSYKNPEWWKNLVSCLDDNDNITFSIDGTFDNFTEYRINADKDSIIDGIKNCVGKVHTSWKFIPFSFNQDNISEAKKYSKELGIDSFNVVYSDRWEVNDPLRPGENMIGNKDYVQQSIKAGISNDFDIVPKCSDESMHFISADGLYAPCAFSKNFNFYYKSKWWKNKTLYNINTSKLSDQLTNFEEFYKTIQEKRYDYCVFNCGKTKIEVRQG